MLPICRACGGSLINEDECVSLEKYIDIYFHLTSIKLQDHEDPSHSKVCPSCIVKLDDFECFRNICLQVHWSLYNCIKVEAADVGSDQELIVEVECKPECPEEDKKQHYTDDRVLNDTSNREEATKSGEESSKSAEESNKDEDYLPETAGNDYNKSRKTRKKCVKNVKLKTDYPKEHRATFNCDQCPKRFMLQQRLEAHKRTHKGLKPYECEICQRTFAGFTYLLFHRSQKHSGEKVFLPCEHPGCEQQFSTRYALKRHTQRVHDPTFVPEITIFVCDTCGKTFASKGNLKKHQYTHTPSEMPFVCGICSKQFPTSNKLKEHNLRHEGVKNHTCPHCGLRKTTMHELRQHIKHMHAHPRSVACEMCPRRFNDVGSLNIHVRIVHLGEKRHKCTVCEWAFGRSDHLKRHMKCHNTS
ncbi:zinc finger protein 595-like [Sabethes cyaneus]|uniref:zinc finger protein 595-like n=1 Tax=Sabethes cyaneus TaxID=53552 RepID=UPI00237DDEB9|nr:zinc finger protein 595-like [Sabethes cyaneus]